MIQVIGSFKKTYSFPAKLESAYRYFKNVPHILQLLPHISVVSRFHHNQFRMLYKTTELGLYRVKIYCDLAAESDDQMHRLWISPLQNGGASVKAQASLNSLTGLGSYSSSSEFRAAGNGTLIEYRLRLEFQVPAPLAVRLAPPQAVNKLAEAIANHRIQEIADGFIQRSILDYQGKLH